MKTLKQKLAALLSKLPDEFPVEDIQYHIYVIEKIHQGLEVIKQAAQVNTKENVNSQKVLVEKP